MFSQGKRQHSIDLHMRAGSAAYVFLALACGRRGRQRQQQQSPHRRFARHLLRHHTCHTRHLEPLPHASSSLPGHAVPPRRAGCAALATFRPPASGVPGGTAGTPNKSYLICHRLQALQFFRLPANSRNSHRATGRSTVLSFSLAAWLAGLPSWARHCTAPLLGAPRVRRDGRHSRVMASVRRTPASATVRGPP